MDGNLCLAAAASADSGSDISLALCLPDGNISSLISSFSISHKEENWTSSLLIMVSRTNTRRVGGAEKAGEVSTYFLKKNALTHVKMKLFFSPYLNVQSQALQLPFSLSGA